MCLVVSLGVSPVFANYAAEIAGDAGINTVGRVRCGLPCGLSKTGDGCTCTENASILAGPFRFTTSTGIPPSAGRGASRSAAGEASCTVASGLITMKRVLDVCEASKSRRSDSARTWFCTAGIGRYSTSNVRNSGSEMGSASRRRHISAGLGRIAAPALSRQALVHLLAPGSRRPTPDKPSGTNKFPPSSLQAE